jgi:hypothetical protein
VNSEIADGYHGAATTGQYGGPASISTASYKLDYVKAAGGVTPTAADLAAHSTKNGDTAWSSGTSAMSAADIGRSGTPPLEARCRSPGYGNE